MCYFSVPVDAIDLVYISSSFEAGNLFYPLNDFLVHLNAD
jgi:hypothetical protein